MDTDLPRPLPPEQRDGWPAFLRTFARIGLNSFGGPVAQIGVMHREAVDHQRWLSDAQFTHLLNFANVLPGPEALELCIHLGYLRRGVAGGIAAGLLFIWPGFLSLTLLAWLYLERGQTQWARAALDGIQPAAMALVAFAAYRLGRRALKGPWALVFAAIAFAATFLGALPFIPVLLGCGLAGVLLRSGPRAGAALHLVIAGLVAALAIAPAVIAAGGERPDAPAVEERGGAGASLADLAWVNTKAALVTFGGAYTVLPYFREQMVERHGWVTDEQMLAGLAFGETTPGPLISVGVFLSFIAGGWAGACVGALFLFLPSFVLVLGLGRHLERVERLPRARDFLHAVSAATIGLILALAAELVPRGVTSPFAAAVALLSLGALAMKAEPWWVVALAAAAGLARLLL